MVSLITNLPQEIHDGIISYLFNDQTALRACALVCRSFCNPSQQQLYSDITIVTNQNISPMFRSRIRATRYLSARRFSTILKLAPVLGTYVRRLRLYNAYVERSSIYEAEMENKLDIVGLSNCLFHLNYLQHLVVDTDTSTFTEVTPSRYAYHEMASRFCSVLSNPSIVSLDIQSLQHILFDLLNVMASKNRQCSPSKLQLNINQRMVKNPDFADSVGTFFRQAIDLQKLENLVLSHSYDVMEYQDTFGDILKTCRHCRFLTQLDIEIWGSSKSFKFLLFMTHVLDKYTLTDEGPNIADLEHFTGLEKLSIIQRHRYGLPRSTNTVPQLLEVLERMPPTGTNRLRALKIGVQYNRAFYDPAIHSTSWVELWQYTSRLDRFPHLDRMEMVLIGADVVCEEIFNDLEMRFSSAPHLSKIDLSIKKTW